MPSVNLVYTRSRELLGDPVEARFGKEFPIRFDLLDTIGGGNLSLQVHPTAEYARENFGLAYTQDESYYIMDTKEDTYVYLGLRNDINPDEMVADLNKAQKDPFFVFDVDKYVNKVPVKNTIISLYPAGPYIVREKTHWYSKSAQHPIFLLLSSGTGNGWDSTENHAR